MKDITVTFVPVESIAKEETPKTYSYQEGQPLPVIGETVSFQDWTKQFKVTTRSLHYVNEDSLQIFFSFDKA